MKTLTATSETSKERPTHLTRQALEKAFNFHFILFIFSKFLFSFSGRRQFDGSDDFLSRGSTIAFSSLKNEIHFKGIYILLRD